MSNPWDGLAESILSEIKTRAKKVWDDNANVRQLLEEAAKDFAKLMWAYKIETDPTLKEAVRQEMEIAKQTIENAASALALIATAEAKATFLAVVNTAFGVLLKALPVILSAI